MNNRHSSGIDLRAERVNYTQGNLNKQKAGSDPHALFDEWLHDAIVRRDTDGDLLEPNAMVLSTINPETEWPDSRVVLLKGHEAGKFVFFGNYESQKGHDLDVNRKAAINFSWLPLQRQIRIQGKVRRVSAEDSDAYFKVRPRGSQIGAWASSQSDVIDTHEHLEKAYERAEQRFGDGEIPRPSYWGGWALTPHRFEFWQGGSSRLHDRIVFAQAGDSSGRWIVTRLAP